MRPEERLAEVTRIYDVHRSTAFPRERLAVNDIGVELVMLDAHTAGCVQVWIGNGGTLDQDRWETLGRCAHELARVRNLYVREPDADYWDRLYRMCVLVRESAP